GKVTVCHPLSFSDTTSQKAERGGFLTRLARPAQFGGSGAGIGPALLRPGTHRFGGDFRINTVAPSRLKGLLHAPVFAGMKGQHGGAPARLEAVGQKAQ